MKCQSYRHIPYCENAVCERRLRRLGFAPGLIHDAR